MDTEQRTYVATFYFGNRGQGISSSWEEETQAMSLEHAQEWARKQAAGHPDKHLDSVRLKD
ncbi:hypothetical protein LUCX_281 [Xanthomonas phage vB_XciM_LucasX]|nr:hypothetical protein LUCX_281 [Xanthomonas phage vB_XciM_LucasX]